MGKTLEETNQKKMTWSQVSKIRLACSESIFFDTFSNEVCVGFGKYMECGRNIVSLEFLRISKYCQILVFGKDFHNDFSKEIVSSFSVPFRS